MSAAGVLLALLVVWAIWRLLFTQSLPQPRSRGLSAVGQAVYSLASCPEGVWLSVETMSGTLVCEFEKRRDPGGPEQDVVLRIPGYGWPDEVIERVYNLLQDEGVSVRRRQGRARSDEREGLQLEVPLFGRREDLGLEAVEITGHVAIALGLDPGAKYVFRPRGGTRNSRLWGRLNADAAGRPDALAKAKRLRDLEEAGDNRPCDRPSAG